MSIVLPVHNAEQYLEKLFANIGDQIYQDYEVLLIDNISSDKTLTVAQKAAHSDPRVRIISETDKGIYDAMNKGINLAKGEWVYFMGADDAFYNQEVLATITKHFEESVDIIYGDVLWMPDGVKEVGPCNPTNLIHRNINHQRVFYRRELFKQWGAYDLRYKVAADHELNIRYFCNPHIRKKYIPLLIASYHSGGYSANKHDEVFWKNWKSIFRENLAAHVPYRLLYDKLGWYCRYLITNKEYKRSFVLFWDVFLHTLSPGFVLLTFRHFISTRVKHAS